MSFEEEMEAEILTKEKEIDFLARFIERYKKTLSEFLELEDEADRYFKMPRAGVAAYMLGSYDKARDLAEEMKALPSEYARSWNDGNLIYYSNWISGMLELDAGFVQASKHYLVLSGECGGSPQLNSFGPNMRLAKRLLNEGEADVFLAFLDSIEIFWKSGGNWITVWRSQIANNRMPNCLMHIF